MALAREAFTSPRRSAILQDMASDLDTQAATQIAASQPAMLPTVLPPGPELPMDASHLALLLAQAMFAVARDLRAFAVPVFSRYVFRTVEDGWGRTLVQAPDYLLHEARDAIATAVDSPEASALLDYLWQNGGAKWTFPAQEQVVGREFWERAIIYRHMIGPALVRLLNTQLAKEIGDTESFTPWRLPPEADVHLAAADLAGRLCHKTRHVWAHCPLEGLHFLQDKTPFAPEPGIIVSPATRQGMDDFFSKFQHDFLSEDEVRFSADAVLDLDLVLPSMGVKPVDLSHPSSDDADIARQVAAAVDRFKWSAALTLGPHAVFEEGPVVIGGPSGWRGRTLRRGTVMTGTRARGLVQVLPGTAERIAKQLQTLKEAQRLLGSEDLDQALWHFGRACNSVLARDILLESVIGLEMILVPEAGDSTYKFSLHGSAILSDAGSTNIAKELSDLYGSRSRLAHGGREGQTEQDRARRARWLLAKAIWGIVVGISNGALRVDATKGNVAKAVKDLVLRTVQAASVGHHRCGSRRPSE